MILMSLSSLAPKYEELAAKYAANKDWASKVTIAKVDATASKLSMPRYVICRMVLIHKKDDTPDEVQGFPTIKLYPAGAKDKPVEYSGDRTVEDLIKFVKENGKHGVDASTAKDDDKKEESAMPNAEELGKAAEAATEKVKEAVKSVASEATEAVKSAAPGSEEPHDEL